MYELTLYHNPRCSKSRQTLELLLHKGLNPLVIDYMHRPLTLIQLKELRRHFALTHFVRTNEAVFDELQLSLDSETEVLAAMTVHPILMQRPIVVYKNKAVIGRPPEQVLALFEAEQ